jgi:hypothetical protein
MSGPVHQLVQPLTIGPNVEPAEPPAAEPAATLESTSRGRLSLGSQRSPRRARGIDRRDALRNLAAEVSAAAAVIHQDDDATASVLLPLRPGLTLLPSRAEQDDANADATPLGGDDDMDCAELRLAANTAEVDTRPTPTPVTVDLTGHRGGGAAASRGETQPTADVDTITADVEQTAMHLEIARAEANVLAAKYDAELAARTAAESRLAAAEGELHFLRAEMQMVGQTRPKAPGRLRRALRLFTRRRRAVLPASGSRK